MGDGEGGALRRELGLDRRDLLRRGLIAGGILVWGTPVIRSISAPAHADHASLVTCCVCSSKSPTAPGECSVGSFTCSDCVVRCGGERYVLKCVQGHFRCGDTPFGRGCVDVKS